MLATGLGKTWLAAFGSRPFPGVLFVAHREEILTQAMSSFRRIRPEARFGRYDGTQKDDGTEILFASIQTLGRAKILAHLRALIAAAITLVLAVIQQERTESYRPAAA